MALDTFKSYMDSFVDMKTPHTGATNKEWYRVLAKKIVDSERAINAKVARIEFRPDVCCEHVWRANEMWLYGGETCAKCGAICVRATDGTIEEYDAGVQWTY